MIKCLILKPQYADILEKQLVTAKIIKRAHVLWGTNGLGLTTVNQNCCLNAGFYIIDKQENARENIIKILNKKMTIWRRRPDGCYHLTSLAQNFN